MKYEPSELGRLAKRLEAAAAVARAKAKQHRLAKENDAAEQQDARAESAMHFSAVCAHFESLLKTKAKRAGFVPPTLQEVLDYVAADEKCQGWPRVDVESWWNHFQSNGWKVSGKTVMVDWKFAARNGATRWRRENPAKAKPKTDDDPAGWKEWLRKKGRRYEVYHYAPSYLKVEFRVQA